MTDIFQREGLLGLEMRRRGFLGLMAAAAGATAIPAPGWSDESGSGVLRISAPTNPSTLDPAKGVSGADHVFLYTIYDTLIEWDFATLEAKPGLAESWEFTDPQTLVLNLRQGVVFHDGTPFDAAAVKFNIERGKADAKSSVKGDLASVVSIEAVASNKVVLKLNRPNSALVLILSDRAGMMVSPAAVQARGADFDRNPVGAGAWRYVSWTDNGKVVVKRNETYWRKGASKVDQLELAIIPDLNTGLRSVAAGENDLVYALTPRLKSVADRDSSLETDTQPTVGFSLIYFNLALAPITDVRVRQAINYAIDRDIFNKAVSSGLGEVAKMAVPSHHWAYDASLASAYPHDPDKARKLLADAGFGGGLEIPMLGWSDQASQQAQEVLIDMLGKVGIRPKMKVGSIADTSSQFYGPQNTGFPIYLSGWSGRPDPTLTYTLMFAKDGFYNAGRVEGAPGVDEAILATQASTDIAERKEAFSRLQHLVVDSALFCPLLFNPEIDAFSRKVKNFKPNLLGKPKFADVSIA